MGSSVPPQPWVPPWDGAEYAANTAHHRAFDDGFLADTPLAAGDRVLDLGCGSGDFTAQLADLVGPEGAIVGVDAQASMLDQARAVARPNQTFVLAPVQALDDAFGPEHDATFDLVLSRSVLHWVPADDQQGVYRSAARLVRPGGHLRIECGGVGNVAPTVALLNDVSTRFGGPADPWTFADPAMAVDWAEQAGFDVTGDASCFVRCVGQRRAFDEGSLLGWLRSQTMLAYEAGIDPAEHAAFRAAVEARLPELRRWDGSYHQTWVRLDLCARRPD